MQVPTLAKELLDHAKVCTHGGMGSGLELGSLGLEWGLALGLELGSALGLEWGLALGFKV